MFEVGLDEKGLVINAAFAFRGVDDDCAVGAIIVSPTGVMLRKEIVAPLLNGFGKRQIFGFRLLRCIASGLKIIGCMREGVRHRSRWQFDRLSVLIAGFDLVYAAAVARS